MNIVSHDSSPHTSSPLILHGHHAYSHTVHSINPPPCDTANVSIDPTNGTLMFSNFHKEGEYDIIVHSTTKSGRKNIASLTLTVQSPQINITAANVAVMTWPFILGSSSKVSFLEDVILTSSSQYFIVNGDDVVINGGMHNIAISCGSSYPGLVQNMGHANCTIHSILVSSSATTVAGGWIGQDFFDGADCVIARCASNGPIGTSSGGIVGTSASLTVTNCYSTGSIAAEGGGIVGSNSDCNIRYCYSTGNVSGIYAGAIMGVNCGGTIQKCYGLGGVLQDPDYSYALITDSYLVSGGWVDATAIQELDAVADPAWILIGTDIPWRLADFNLNLDYNPTNTIKVATQGTSQSPPPSTTLQGAVYSILSGGVDDHITIDSATGVLTLTALPEGTYHIQILALTPLGQYSVVDLTVIADPAHCFLRGTMIQTPFGERPIEDLSVNDVILTADLRIVPILGILRARMSVPYIRIPQGYFGKNRPSRPTVLSTYHAILWENCWVIPQSNTGLFEIEECDDMNEFYHVILEDHEAILANNLPCESFADPCDFIIQSHPCPIRNHLGIQYVTSYTKITASHEQKNNTIMSTMISVM